MSARLFHTDDASAMIPSALPALADVRARGLAHRFVLHVRSSQAFALNLFAPLEEDGLVSVFRGLGYEVEQVEAPAFEYSETLDRLQEASRPGGHQTQVDVVLRGATSEGQRVIALIEVKLGETSFGPCSAFDNLANRDLGNCHSSGLFGATPDRCFQLRNHGHGHRRYAEYLAKVPIRDPAGSGDEGGCYLRADRSQPMRSLALAHLLVDEGDCDSAVLVVCAPDRHPSIWRRFGEFTGLFGGTDAVSLEALPAEVVARYHPDGGAEFLRRYRPILDA